MPIAENFVPPEVQSFGPIPAGIYDVEIADVEYEEKESPFKNPKTGELKMSQRYIVTFKVLEGDQKDTTFRSFLNANLKPPKEATKPSFAKLLKAVTGEEWTLARSSEITPALLNSLIGSKLKVVTDVQQKKDGTGSYTLPTQFMK